MSSKAYHLGLDAGKRGLWFYATRNNYLASGVLSHDDLLEFYEGYWGDLFKVRYTSGRISLVNREYD